MKAWELDEVRRGLKGKWLMRAEEGLGRRFTGKIGTDSRKVTEGELFFAIAGKNHDAHDFVGAVVDSAAAGIVVHQEPTAEVLAAAKAAGIAVILVDETVAALNRLAAAYRKQMRAKVIAVGGSNGKTTTKRIIHALLAEKYGESGGHASPKSFNNNIGMPLTLLGVEVSHEYVVLEIGTNAPGEIAALGEVCRPDIAVITSVGLEHLERLGDLEGVAREEASIAPFVAEGGGGTLVLPADAPELLEAVKLNDAQRILVGREQMQIADSRFESSKATADLLLTDVKEGIDGTMFSINGRGSFRVPLLGEHNAMNALMAIAVARRLGLSDDQIAAGLLKVKTPEGRFEVLEVGGHRVINDAYNANPSSMEVALKTFGRLEVADGQGSEKSGKPGAGRKVVILGDMLELGVTSEAMHRSIGAMVAAWRFDLFIAVGPNMRFAADVAQAGGVKVVRCENTSAAVAGIMNWLEPADRILLKGSRGMALEAILVSLGKGMAATSKQKGF